MGPSLQRQLVLSGTGQETAGRASCLAGEREERAREERRGENVLTPHRTQTMSYTSSLPGSGKRGEAGTTNDGRE